MRGAREDGDDVAHVLLVSHVILGEHLDRVDGWMPCDVIATVTHVCQSTKTACLRECQRQTWMWLCGERTIAGIETVTAGK